VQGLDVELEDLAVHRHRVLHTHHELHVQRAGDAAIGLHLCGLEDHRQVEGLDLRLDAVLQHLAGQPVDQVGRVVVDAGGEVA